MSWTPDGNTEDHLAAASASSVSAVRTVQSSSSRGAAGGRHDLRQQAQAVRVCPLEIVDDDHDRRLLGEPRSTMSCRSVPKTRMRSSCGSPDSVRRTRRARQRADPAQAGNTVRSSEAWYGQDRGRRSSGGMRPSATGRPSMTPSNALYGVRLPLVATPDQRQRSAAPSAQAIAELAHEHALAHAGLAMEQHDRRRPDLDGVERGVELLAAPCHDRRTSWPWIDGLGATCSSARRRPCARSP